MTTDQLKKMFNKKFSPTEPWPKSYEVDHETYANVCQSVFNHMIENENQISFQGDTTDIPISLGPKNGLMFKGVELILKGY